MRGTGHGDLPWYPSCDDDSVSLTDATYGSERSAANSSCTGFLGSVIAKAKDRAKKARTREASQRTKRNGSMIAAVVTFLILAMAIRSCIPPEATTWHKQARPTHPTHLTLPPAPNHEGLAVAALATTVLKTPATSNHTRNTTMSKDRNATAGPISSPRRRLKLMEFKQAPVKQAPVKQAPEDLKNLHRNKVGKMEFHDPKSTSARKAMPLTGYQVNPLVKPDGYPWHRWKKPNDGSYPLDSKKFVEVLSRLGRGEDNLGTVTPNNYTVGGVPLTPDVIRLGNKVRPYVIRKGTVLRPGGRTGMFVTLVQRAVEMASLHAEDSPRMKLLSEGRLPLIFDANDYPWCGDDLVPVFRLNAIRDPGKCRHSWPAMSLTYFQDPTNVQLTESPYQWDEMMAGWDRKYPWENKIPKAVWRGRITGYTYRDGERPRQELVRYGRDHLDIMDIKPSTQRSKMDQDDFQKYKAIIDIDGNAWSARLGKLLCFNSVVIKIEPTYVGYWEKEIEPWVHYIPAEADFSDLEKTVRYVLDPANSEQMQKIVKNGQQFCRTKLTMEQYTVDMLWSLLAYAEVLAGSPDFYDVWKKDEGAYKMEALRMAPWKPRVAGAMPGDGKQ